MKGERIKARVVALAIVPFNCFDSGKALIMCIFTFRKKIDELDAESSYCMLFILHVVPSSTLKGNRKSKKVDSLKRQEARRKASFYFDGSF